MSDTSTLEALVQALRRLPGVGVKSASRMAFHLLQNDRAGAEQLSRALHEATTRVRHCERCHTFTEGAVCEVCLDPGRDATRLAVVETPADQSAMERTGAFKGLYFVLMGRLSPLDGVGPDDLNIRGLVDRVAKGGVRELIIAVNATVEGQTTAHYITDQLEGFDIKISRLAHGVPVGGELDYLDEGTLTAALRARTSL